jgi:hypothetical protein
LWNVFYFEVVNDTSTGRKIFEVAVNYFVSGQKITWQWCIPVCADGAATMTDRLSDFVLWVKKENTSFLITVTQKQALASKKLDPVLHKTLTEMN